MVKRIFACFLALVLLITGTFSVCAKEVSASHVDPEDIENSMRIVSDAIDDMQEYIEGNPMDIQAIFQNFAAAFKATGSVIGTINATVAFLKLVGIMKDPVASGLADIMSQLQIISEQLDSMDRKLSELMDQMTTMQAKGEFADRTQKALEFQSTWRQFERWYMEDGLDKYIRQFNAMALDGIQAWCKDPENGRTAGGIENRQLVLVYDQNGDQLEVQYLTENTDLSDLDENACYVVLDSRDFLPDAIAWNVNTYRETIQKAVSDYILSALEEDPQVLVYQNMPELESKSEEAIQRIAEDAVNMIAYRATAAQLNKSSEFSLNVEDAFKDYCAHLLEVHNGLDAVTTSMFLTHAFEYEIAEDFTTFFNQMAIKTGVYGAFMMNVAGMSNYLTDTQKLNALDTYCNTLKKLSDNQTNGLTGMDNYCYVTNTPLAFGTITFTSSAKMKVKNRGMVNAVEEYSASDITTTITYGAAKKKATPENLIGNTDMKLLQLYLAGGGIDPDYCYYTTYLGENVADDYGQTVTEMGVQQAIPSSDVTSLKCINIMGDYFAGSSNVKMRFLPGDAEREYFKGNKMIAGSLMSTDNGTISLDQTLAAMALYAESHFYWQCDEGAILGGPLDAEFFSPSYEKVYIENDFFGAQYYNHLYNQQVTYNCMIKVSGKFSGSKRNVGPLASYVALCKEIRQQQPIEELETSKEEEPVDEKEKSPETGEPAIKLGHMRSIDTAKTQTDTMDTIGWKDLGFGWLLLGMILLAGAGMWMYKKKE